MDPLTEPRWRALKVEASLQKYSEAENKYEVLGAILKGEQDLLAKDYFKYRLRLIRPGEIAPQNLERFPRLKALAYAHDCIATSDKTFQASMIRAMAVAGRKPEEIAGEFATVSSNISVFLQLFFDVQPLLPYDALLQGVVLRAQTQAPGNDTAPQEAHWLRVAYRSGWEVLQFVIFGRPLKDPAKMIKRLDDQMTGQLAIRAREFTDARLTSSEPGSALDFKNYVEHKRVSLKAKIPEGEKMIHSNFAQEFMTAVVNKADAEVAMVHRERARDPRMRAMMADDECEIREWEARLAHFSETPADAHLRASEEAVYLKSRENRKGAILELQAKLAIKYPEPPKARLTGSSRDAPAQGSADVGSTRAPHWGF